MDKVYPIKYTTKTGRCQTATDNTGSVVHAVPTTLGLDKALCGAKPGPRSGWSQNFELAPTCSKCIKRLPMWESAQRVLAEQAKTRGILAGGVCPLCGAGIRHNLSLKGWVQCVQLGAVGFRQDPTKPSCSWQGFTE